MGMDVDVYRLLAPITADEAFDSAVKCTRLSISNSQKTQLARQYPQAEFEQTEYIDEVKLRGTYEIADDYQLSNWDLATQDGWVSFSTEGSPDILLEVPSDDFIIKEDTWEVYFTVKQLGYLRKPFKRGAAPVYFENGCLTLTAGDFEGADVPALTAILGAHAMDNGMRTFLVDERATLIALQPHCADPDVWAEQVLARVTDEDCVVRLSW
jgi:hypothetical protein